MFSYVPALDGVIDVYLVHDRFTCSDPPEKGQCNETITRYYFNVQNKTCQEFVYGGCQGNANNYETYEECRVSCE
ncbi:hypothetical protein MTO96_034923, partial [Rhipicephalus appendiculatus]